MIIPGPLVALLTFPGVVMHEIAHRFMCDILCVPVYDVSYFSIGDTRAGHVAHHKTDNLKYVLLISFAPLFINSFFCMFFTLPYASTIVITGEGISTYPSLFLYWVGISMGANAFPSNQDVDNALSLVCENNGSLTTRALCRFMKLLNTLSFFWIDFIYAGVISFILPALIFRNSGF